jgi:hypothetical protein
MTEHQDIYVRAHTIQLGTSNCDPADGNREPKWSEYVLIFDCETRTTTDQTLIFGCWQFCKKRNEIYVPLEEAIVHDDNELKDREFNILRNYAMATKPNTEDDGSDRLRLYCRSKFISEVLGMAIQADALIVGFNLPFDLSRLAVDWTTAENGGWSLILSQWRNPNTQELGPNKFFPRIVVKALNSKTALIHSTRAQCQNRRRKGHLWLFGPRLGSWT